VFPQGRHRLRITGAHASPKEASALLRWLGQRAEVIRVDERRKTGVLYVDYDDGPSPPGRFLRALRDKVSAFTAGPAKSFSVELLHALPGRARFLVRGLGRQQLTQLAEWAAGLRGVLHIEALPDSGSLLVHYRFEQVSRDELLDALRRSSPADWPALRRCMKRPTWGRMLSASAVLLLCGSRALPPSLLSAGVLFHTLRPIARSLQALGQGDVCADVLDVAGTAAALATGQRATAAFIIWMVEAGELLLAVSANRARAAIARLMRLETTEAFRIRQDGTTERVPASHLVPGDKILIGAGARIAADGQVASGEALVDEKALTGESLLRSKRPFERVLAETVVVEGQILVVVERSGMETAAGQAVKILQSAAAKPLTLQREALRTAGRLVMPTFGVAGLAALLASDIARAVSIVITDFGAGIRIAVPTIALAAMTSAARQGVLIKGAQYLERMAKADAIIFDKTGTLTEGEPEVVEVLAASSHTAEELVSLCASAEARQSHPIARALRRYAELHGIDVSVPELGSESYVIGHGLSARVRGRQVHVGSSRYMQEKGLDIEPLSSSLSRLAGRHVSVLFVAVDGKVAGIIGYADAVRKESAVIVNKLKETGRRRVLLLSGDAAGPVQAVAQAVGVDEARGSLLPDEKAASVRALRQSGRVVAMVGDGINDAPALALADVGISISGSTDLAVETADVVLLEGGLAQLAEAFSLSSRTMTSVRLGLGLILIPNAIAMLLGLFGRISPPTAALINNGATIASVLFGAAPLALPSKRRVRKARRDGHDVRAKTTAAAVTAGLTAAALSPLPMADELALLAVYVDLTRRIADSHGLALAAVPWRPILRTIVNALLVRATMMLPLSFVPGVATVLSSTTAAALTRILGRYIDAACRCPGQAAPIGVQEMAAQLRRLVRKVPEAKSGTSGAARPRQKM